MVRAVLRIGSRLRREQRGSTIVLAGLSLTLLLAATGLVLDGGMLYAAKSRMQKAANAAALSGAQRLIDDPAVAKTNVNNVVTTILDKNGEKANFEKTDVQIVDTAGARGGSNVRVWLKQDVPLGFGQLFGRRTATVRVNAAAKLVPLGTAQGAVPIGIEDTVKLDYSTTYTLKFDEQTKDYGWYGILDMDGTGGATYRNLMENGSTTTFSVDDVLDTIFGIKTGPTFQGIQARLDECGHVDCSAGNPDSPRIILVPVYHRNVDYGQTKNVTIVGFASFYITDPTAKDKEINGKFLREIESGPTKPKTVDDGTYGIRLID